MTLATRPRIFVVLLLAIGGRAGAQGDAGVPAPGPVPGLASPELGPVARLRAILLAPLSTEDDPDGPISTDRPTFTPANTVVPLGRFQVESGYTYSHDLTGSTRFNAHDFPELSVRLGVAKRLEFRTFWLGQTYSRQVPRRGGPVQNVNGPNDMEIGFKTQVIEADEDRPWLPTTALITSVFAPVGGTSPYSSRVVNPYVSLIYGWTLTDKLTLTGSTNYQAMRQTSPKAPADSFERFSQSLVASYAATGKTTLFYEWYVLTYTNAADNRPTHTMDGGFLYRPTPNTQFDLRAGFGLGDRPTDFFTGAGFSIRY